MDVYINREQALKKLTQLEIDNLNFTMADIKMAIMSVPLANVAPVRHAYWKSLPNKLARVCSFCEHDEPDKFADMDVNIFNYCSYCGAKMDERH